MAVGYELVNFTRREVLTFAHIPASTKLELAGNAAAAAMSTWYMLECAGDQMAFVCVGHLRRMAISRRKLV